MTVNYTNPPDNAEEGYKCASCGFMWTSREVLDVCPSCGARCNPYCCRIVDSSNEDY